MRGQRLIVVATGLALVAVYAGTVAHAVQTWWADPELSVGFFSLPAAGLVAWSRRDSLRAARDEGSWMAIGVVAVGLALYLGGRAAGVAAVAALSLPAVVAGAAGCLFGLRFAALTVPPALVAAFGMSFYRGLLAPLGFELQRLTAALSSGLAMAAGVPVRRSGVDLIVNGKHFVVAQACSGMDSLLAMLFIGLVVAAMVSAPVLARLLVLAAAVPIALVANVLRVTTVLFSAAHAGINVEAGAAHNLLSAAVFGFAAVCFCALLISLRCLPQWRAG